MSIRSALTSLLAAVVLAACSASLPPPRYVVEQPVGADTWVEVGALPDWVERAHPSETHLRFVATGRSNVRSIATVDRGPRPREARAVVLARLAPAVGVEAATAAAARVDDALVLVARACKDELLTRDPVAGNTLSTAYALWELPIADVVAGLPDDRREAGARALASASSGR